MPRFIQNARVTATGAGTLDVSAEVGIKRYIVEAWSGGGSSANLATAEGAGAGGNYARSICNAVTGVTTIYYTVGGTTAGSTAVRGSNSWVNINNANSAPTTSAEGCFAIGGPGATTATGATGSSAGSIGTTLFAGGNGGTGATAGGATRSGGGGGGSAGSGGAGGNGGNGGTNSGGTAGAAGNAGSANGDVDYSAGPGATGGQGSATTAAGSDGSVPGGAGGGGANATGSNGGLSQSGAIRISYNRKTIYVTN